MRGLTAEVEADRGPGQRWGMVLVAGLSPPAAVGRSTTVALAAGLAVLLRRKGGRAHRALG